MEKYTTSTLLTFPHSFLCVPLFLCLSFALSGKCVLSLERPSGEKAVGG